MPSKRWYACKEFYDTEKSYVAELQYGWCVDVIFRLINSVFIDPMKSSGMLSDELESALFGNIKAILEVHKKFLDDLDSRCMDGQYDSVCIGMLFKDYTPFLKLYRVYVQSQKNFVIVYKEMVKNKNIYAFLSQAQCDPQCRGMDLSSFLIEPVQRIPRYRLLLNEIIKHTDPVHPDYTFLKDDICIISNVATLCDESLNWEEDSQILYSLQNCAPDMEIIRPNRYIVRKVYVFCCVHF